MYSFQVVNKFLYISFTKEKNVLRFESGIFKFYVHFYRDFYREMSMILFSDKITDML